jgi:hypothetical protein
MGAVLVVAAGRMANRMIQRIAAETIKNRLEMRLVYSPSFPQWDRNGLHGYELVRKKFQVQAKYFPNSVQILSGNNLGQESIKGKNTMLVGNMLNLDVLDESKDFARQYFPISKKCKCCAHRKSINLDDFNIVHVRLGDIWAADTKTAVSYFPLSLDFYRAIADLCPKPFAILAEIGSTEENDYVNKIMDIRSGSILIGSGCTLADFQFLRQARTLTLSTSTYSWLAYWLSQKTKHVYVPNAGLFSQKIRPDVNLIPSQTHDSLSLIPASRYSFN